MVQLADRVSILDKSRSADGFLKLRARSARAGVYDYLGAEVDPEGKTFKADQLVKVYRPADEVFDKASLASFVGRPITNDHPAVPVNASNWRDHARGAIFGAVKDGDYVGFDLAFMDAATIADIDAGKRELSNGYSCDLIVEDGVSPDGVSFQAVQRNIRGNHCALVDRGRAGSDCRVADAHWATCDANPAALSALTTPSPQETRVKITNLDGMPVNLSDAAAVEAALTKLDQKVTDASAALKAAQDKTVADAATLTAKDEKIAELEKKLADAAITPAKLADAAKVYNDVCAKAKALGVTHAEDADTAAIKKAVVAAKMGDAAKDYSDEHVTIAFDALTKDVKADDKANVQPIGSPVITGDSASVRDAARNEYIDRLTGKQKEAA